MKSCFCGTGHDQNELHTIQLDSMHVTVINKNNVPLASVIEQNLTHRVFHCSWYCIQNEMLLQCHSDSENSTPINAVTRCQLHSR